MLHGIWEDTQFGLYIEWRHCIVWAVPSVKSVRSQELLCFKAVASVPTGLHATSCVSCECSLEKKNKVTSYHCDREVSG